MTCSELKARARDVVWVGRVALSVALLPLFVPLLLLGPAQHVLREWCHQLHPAGRAKAPR